MEVKDNVCMKDLGNFVGVVIVGVNGLLRGVLVLVG